MIPWPLPLVLNAAPPTEVRLCRFPRLQNKTNKTRSPTRPGKNPPLSAAESRALAPQSDFSFSFMCKKTMLKMKSPAIMEKALA